MRVACETQALGDFKDEQLDEFRISLSQLR